VGIARATGVPESWLQGYVNASYVTIAGTAVVAPKAKGKLRVQMDELWSFVDDNGQSSGSG
jgi:insertion element IS1 protein InsB